MNLGQNFLSHKPKQIEVTLATRGRTKEKHDSGSGIFNSEPWGSRYAVSDARQANIRPETGRILLKRPRIAKSGIAYRTSPSRS